MIVAEYCTQCKRAINPQEQAHLKSGNVVCPDCATGKTKVLPQGMCSKCGILPGHIAYRINGKLLCRKCFFSMHADDICQNIMPTAGSENVYVRHKCNEPKCQSFYFVNADDLELVPTVCPKCGNVAKEISTPNKHLECLMSIRLVLWLMFWFWLIGSIIGAISTSNSSGY